MAETLERQHELCEVPYKPVHSISDEEYLATLDPIMICAETVDIGPDGRPQDLVWGRDTNRMTINVADNSHHSFDTGHLKEKLTLHGLKELVKGADY